MAENPDPTNPTPAERRRALLLRGGKLLATLANLAKLKEFAILSSASTPDELRELADAFLLASMPDGAVDGRASPTSFSACKAELAEALDPSPRGHEVNESAALRWPRLLEQVRSLRESAARYDEEIDRLLETVRLAEVAAEREIGASLERIANLEAAIAGAKALAGQYGEQRDAALAARDEARSELTTLRAAAQRESLRADGLAELLANLVDTAYQRGWSREVTAMAVDVAGVAVSQWVLWTNENGRSVDFEVADSNGATLTHTIVVDQAVTLADLAAILGHEAAIAEGVDPVAVSRTIPEQLGSVARMEGERDQARSEADRLYDRVAWLEAELEATRVGSDDDLLAMLKARLGGRRRSQQAGGRPFDRLGVRVTSLDSEGTARDDAHELAARGSSPAPGTESEAPEDQ